MGTNSNISRYAITIWLLILNVLCLSSHSIATNNSVTHINLSSLDDYLYKYSSKSISKKTRTGVLYNITLPSNFSGMEVSIVRLRSSEMWARGVNFSNFDIPTRVITLSYVKRLAIMYENLGNLSSHYYDLPGYTFLSYIQGFMIYNATDLSGNANPQRLNITLAGEPIKVTFPEVKVSRAKDVKVIKCVRFDPISNLVELSDMVRPNVCLTKGLGHFAIVMPSVIGSPMVSPSPSPSSMDRTSRKFALWKGWLIGFGIGIAGLIVLILTTTLCYRAYAKQKLSRMERNAEKSETLDTRWIGSSKMPFAPVTRTQAVLENDFAP